MTAHFRRRCERSSGDLLLPYSINSASGLDLHRFAWAEDASIGALPLEWNWLVGEYPHNPAAKIAHFTRGGPWFENWQNVDYGDLWLAERALMERDMPYREAPGLVPAAGMRVQAGA